MSELSYNIYTKVLSGRYKKTFLGNLLFKQLHNFKIDPMTGVGTLNFVMKQGRKLLDADISITILVIGLDNFRKYNVSFGHLTANKLLIEFGDKLIERVARFNGIVGKLGGDEFIVLIPDKRREDAGNYSGFISRSLEDELYTIDSYISPFNIHFSIGEAAGNKESIKTIDKLLQIAESNMHNNKFMNRIINKDFVHSNDLFKERTTQLTKVLAEKDMYTYIHSQYVSIYAVSIAEELGMSDEFVESIYYAGWLHDIGKITISDDILRKPAKLDNIEFSLVKNHVINGVNLMKAYEFDDVVINATLHHHERWDGTGYPCGKKGEDIPLEGRILQIADAVSAMMVKRVYRDQLSIEAAIDEVINHSKTQFDPEIVEIFINILRNKDLSM